MKAISRAAIATLILVTCLSSVTYAQSAAPAMFFTDLTSGPNAGGESVSGFAGAYVTLYGNNFGTSQGASTVTLNGANCLRVVSWGTSWLWYQKIVVQLGASCTSGNFAVTVGSQTSNVLPFTVRAGAIHFVASGGSNTGAGTVTAPWANVSYAVSNMAAGDITYVRNGVTTQGEGGVYNAGLILSGAGTATAPKAIVVYPGATATIGAASGSNNRSILYCYSGLGSCTTANYWVVAGFNILAPELMQIGTAGSTNPGNLRIVGNDFQCPNGDGASACVEIAQDDHVDMLGNNVHNVGVANASKLYHAIYYGSGSNSSHETIAWNAVHDNTGCRGIQVHVDGGQMMTDIHVHHNQIYNIRCDGINLNTVNPGGAGGVEVYNNLVYNTGRGPDPVDGSAGYVCIRLNDNTGTSTGTAQVYNNTTYNCGSGGSDTSGQGVYSIQISTNLRNNINYQQNGKPYFVSQFTVPCTNGKLSGSNNDFFGGSGNNCSTTLTNELAVNPSFVSAGTDFHLLSSSPMVDTGTLISSLSADLDGISRPQGSAFDIGAYEYFTGTVATRPNAPTNLTVVVH